MQLERIDPTSLQLGLDGRAVTLDLIAARNLTVEVVEAERIEPGLERLDALRVGEEGVVVRLGWALQGNQRRRLSDLGLVPGTVVRAELSSMSGDPMAYRIRGALIALRRPQARGIYIRRAPVAAEVGLRSSRLPGPPAARTMSWPWRAIRIPGKARCSMP